MKTFDMRRIDAPYLADPKDPAYREINRDNSIKVLTIMPERSILKYVKRTKQKGRQMAVNKKLKYGDNYALISTAWLLFAIQQAYIGVLVWHNFNTLFAVLAAILSLGIAIAVIIAHFIRAHK